VAVILAVLALASRLRRFGYAYWAGAVTAVLSLLYGYYGQSGTNLLLQRLGEIVIGAALGTADLGPLAARFGHGLERLDQMVTPLEAHRRLVRCRLVRQRPGVPHPADAVDAMRACAGPVRVLTTLAAGDGPRDETEFARVTDDLAARTTAARTALLARPGPEKSL